MGRCRDWSVRLGSLGPTRIDTGEVQFDVPRFCKYELDELVDKASEPIDLLQRLVDAATQDGFRKRFFRLHLAKADAYQHERGAQLMPDVRQ